MEHATLVGMANRIGDFFAAMPDRDQALRDIADHIHRFWEPRMCAQLAQVLADPAQADKLKPFVREALLRHLPQQQPG